MVRTQRSLLTVVESGKKQRAQVGSEKPPELGFDEVVVKLNEVVARLESGNLSLEGSLAAYEQGIALARRGHMLLDGAEKRVELLLRNSRGEVTTTSLDAEADSDNSTEN